MATKIETIINGIAERRSLAGVTRRPLSAAEIPSMDTALSVMEALGKRRNPKFRIDDHNRWTYTQLIKWLYGVPDMKALDPDAAAQGKMRVIPGKLTAGIYIGGGTGTGKSWALEILNIFADIDAPIINLGDKITPIHYGCIRAEDIWEACTANDAILSRYKTMPILCIQDLGSEPVSDAVRMGTRREPLRQILDARGDRNDLITLITSNFGICDPEIERRYTDRVVSRLREMCNMLVITGPDRRRL